MNDFPVIDTVPIESVDFPFVFENWLSNLVDSLNDMFFVGRYSIDSSVGSNATIAIPVPNARTNQIAFAQLESSNNPASVQTVITSTDTLTVVLDAAPGVSSIAYAIFRI